MLCRCGVPLRLRIQRAVCVNETEMPDDECVVRVSSGQWAVGGPHLQLLRTLALRAAR